MFKKVMLAVLFTVLMSSCIFARGWVSDGIDWQYIDIDGVMATDTIKSSGDDKYYLDDKGNMVRDYLLEEYNDGIYYFDDSGKMVKNTWVAVDPSQVVNQMDMMPTVYLYYFGANGKAFKANSGVVRKTIDGKKYLFNEYGQMLSGWINENGERYDENDTDMDPFDGYCYFAGDETDGVLREGWTEYLDGSVKDEYYRKESLWFYFRSRDNKKIMSGASDTLIKKKINGNTYAFDERGVLITGWDSDMVKIATTSNYFSENRNEIGRMHKKEWVYAIPSALQNYEDHDADTQRWFYSIGSGDIVKSEMKKINADYYVFDEQGIMKSGLCVIDKASRRYIDCIDAEKTEGKDFILSCHYISKDKYSAAKEYEVFDEKTERLYFFNLDEEDNVNFGKRRIGKSLVPFADYDYDFYSTSFGEYKDIKNKKYYQNGILLKAEPAYGYGLVFIGYATNSEAARICEEPVHYNSTHVYACDDNNHVDTTGAKVKSDYVVLKNAFNCRDKGYWPVYKVVDKTGKVINKLNYALKDKSNYYWMLGKEGTLINIFEVPIRYNKNLDVWQFRSEIYESSRNRVSTKWIDFGTKDNYGKTCYTYRTDNSIPAPSAGAECGGYEVYMDENMCLNFRFSDN